MLEVYVAIDQKARLCHERIPRVFSDTRSMVFAPYQKHSPFGTVVLTMGTASRHLEMLPRIKHARLSLRCERELTCQNKHTSVEGMQVRLGGQMSRLTYPFDNIPLTFPLGFNLCSIRALFSIIMKVCARAPYTTCSIAGLSNPFSTKYITILARVSASVSSLRMSKRI
jgi:hypothetical protein